MKSNKYRKPSKAYKIYQKRKAALAARHVEDKLVSVNWQRYEHITTTLDRYLNEKLLSRNRVSEVKLSSQNIYVTIESSEKYWEQVIKPQLLQYGKMWKFPVSFCRQKKLYTLTHGVRVYIRYHIQLHKRERGGRIDI